MLTSATLVVLNHEKSASARTSDLATVWLDPGTGTVHLIGEIDFSNSQTVYEALDTKRSPHSDMVLDLSRLEFLDCFGLRFIAKLAGRLQSEQRRLILLTVRSIVRRVIDATDLSDHPNLTVVDRISQADSERSASDAGWVQLA